MFNNKIYYIILFMLLGCALSAPAQLALSLDECIRIALSENPTIKVKEMEITRVDYSRKEAIAKLLPTINLSGQYTRNLSLQTMYMDTPNGTMAIKMGSDNTHAAGFQAQIPLVVPQLWKSIKLNENQILQNVETARSNKLSLVNQVEKAYYALLLAQDSKRVIEENHATAKLNAEIFQKKFDLGAASEYDVLRANVAVTNLEPSILEAENSIVALMLQLKVLMGMDVRTEITPSQQLSDFRGEMYARALSNTLGSDTTLANNTSLKSMDLQTDYLKKALDVQKMAWYPTLSGSASLMWHSMNNGSPVSGLRWSRASNVGLTLAFPIFQGGQRYYKQKQAQIAYDEMKWQRENLERSLRMQVETQNDVIAKNLKQIESNEDGVKMAQKANDIMQQSFKIGAASFIQLRDTEDALMAARLAYYQAIYNYLVAESDLEFVLGNTHYVK
ncbi:MAG: TolC family protein [Muribaculaceae bacterium]|jgi:outer membrane protein TolC|nr:TolC family protein [Muribaculaceae bacterium]